MKTTDKGLYSVIECPSDREPWVSPIEDDFKLLVDQARCVLVQRDSVMSQTTSDVDKVDGGGIDKVSPPSVGRMKDET